ncbi:MAG TPA: glycosyltransferase, partial [Gaiellaceae bacterium]
VATIHHPITVDLRLELEAAPSRLRRLALRRWYGFHRMQARVARRIAPVLTVSAASAADIVRDFGVRPDALRIVGAGVDATVFRPRAEPRVPGRIVAVSSSDSPLKGLLVLVEAVARLQALPGLELVVAGRPAPNGPVARAVADRGLGGTVRFVDGLSDEALARLLASAEAAVVPSLYEGFSLPAIEAMACSTPLVATRAGALPEVVGTDGSCASLVAPGDPCGLAAAIAALLRDPGRRSRMGEAGRARVLCRYAWEAVARETAGCYEEAIAFTAPPGRRRSSTAVPRPLPLPVAEEGTTC